MNSFANTRMLDTFIAGLFMGGFGTLRNGLK